jgi:type IV pilus assembly protein PilA
MKKNKSKGFTLIELLVVVAIIGILASVGVVAYNGYTTSAQKSSANTNYESVAKWINNEVQKCNVGETRAMIVGTGAGQVSLTCANRTSTTIATAARLSQRHALSKMANPYDKTLADGSQNFAVTADGAALGGCSPENRGQIAIRADGTNVLVEVCTAAAIAAADNGGVAFTGKETQTVVLN